MYTNNVFGTTWLVLFGFTAVAFWKGEIFISSPEAVIRDSFKVHIHSEKQKQPDVEAGVHPVDVPEMSYSNPYGSPSFDVADSRVVSSRASTVTVH